MVEPKQWRQDGRGVLNCYCLYIQKITFKRVTADILIAKLIFIEHMWSSHEHYYDDRWEGKCLYEFPTEYVTTWRYTSPDHNIAIMLGNNHK